MQQLWTPKGLIYSKRAQIPTILMEKDYWRIYFSDRTVDNKSFIKYIDVEVGNPSNILRENRKPVIDLGRAGEFDHYGIMPSYVHRDKNLVKMLYIGWSVRCDVPYSIAVGEATSYDDGVTFVKENLGPIYGQSKNSPYFSTTPFMHGKKIFLAICDGWVKDYGSMEPIYSIYDNKQRVINYKSPMEGGICRPTICDNIMWYCYRGITDYRGGSGSYKIGFAEKNGENWSRIDKIDIKSSNWDSKMQCYPYIIEYNSRYYMFYNGNGFGTSGFGYAVMDKME